MRRFLAFLIAFFALAAPADAAWVWPVQGEVITPYRNGADPYAGGQHRGIDIGAPVGTPVIAAAGGDVRFAGTAGSSGLTIGIRTGDGYDTSYLHLSSIAVRAGGHVSAGDRIGAVGTTGVRSAQEPHLHFGVRDAGTRHDYHDPLAFLPPPPAPRAPEPPRAPAPVRAPAPAPPAAAPVTAPRPSPAPVVNRLPEPDGVPRPHAHGAPRPAPHPLTRPSLVPRAGVEPTTQPDRAPAPVRRRSPQARGDFRETEPAPPHESSPARQRLGHRWTTGSGAPIGRQTGTPPRKPDGGPDIAWAVACAGLLLAAALLGLTGDRRRAGAGARSILRRALPALGRR